MAEPKQIKLTQGLSALVDAEDFERVSAFKWCASRESNGRKWYAIRREYERGTGKRTKIRLHRFILGLGSGRDCERVVDHLNGDTLDNRKCNLEIVTHLENMARASGWNRKKEEPIL